MQLENENTKACLPLINAVLRTAERQHSYWHSDYALFLLQKSLTFFFRCPEDDKRHESVLQYQNDPHVHDFP